MARIEDFLNEARTEALELLVDISERDDAAAFAGPPLNLEGLGQGSRAVVTKRGHWEDSIRLGVSPAFRGVRAALTATTQGRPESKDPFPHALRRLGTHDAVSRRGVVPDPRLERVGACFTAVADLVRDMPAEEKRRVHDHVATTAAHVARACAAAQTRPGALHERSRERLTVVARESGCAAHDRCSSRAGGARSRRGSGDSPRTGSQSVARAQCGCPRRGAACGRRCVRARRRGGGCSGQRCRIPRLLGPRRPGRARARGALEGAGTRVARSARRVETTACFGQWRPSTAARAHSSGPRPPRTAGLGVSCHRRSVGSARAVGRSGGSASVRVRRTAGHVRLGGEVPLCGGLSCKVGGDRNPCSAAVGTR